MPTNPTPHYKLCRECGQPMLPKGAKKHPNEYDHAQRCPLDPKQASRDMKADRYGENGNG